MGTPHKHAKQIKAWADGATIQLFTLNHGWIDCTNNVPLWSDNTKYRVKPTPKTATAYFLLSPGGHLSLDDKPLHDVAKERGWKQVGEYTFTYEE